MHFSRIACLLSCSFVFTSFSLAGAQTVQTLVRGQDALSDGGHVGTLDNVHVLDDGTWFARGTRSGTVQDFFALKNGISVPPLGADPDWDYDDDGNRLHFEDGLRLLWNGIEVVGPATTDALLLALGLSDHAFNRLDGFKLTGPGQVALWLRLVPPGEPSMASGHPVVVLLDLDPLGTVLSVATIVAPAAPGNGVLNYPPADGPHNYAVNDHGRVLFCAVNINLGAGVYLDTDPVAEIGMTFSDPSDPLIDGRSITSFAPYTVDLNDSQDIVYRCRVDGDAQSDSVLVRNNTKLYQEGETLPALLGATLGDTNNAPLYIANDGHVYWGTQLGNAQPAFDRAWMRDGVPIVRRGQVLTDGRVVTQITLRRNGFHVSDDGRFWVGRVGLDGEPALVMVDFGGFLALPSSTPHEASLELLAGRPLLGSSMIFELDGAQASGVLTTLLVSPDPALPGSLFGIPTPYGELLIGTPSLFLLGTPWVGTPSFVAASMPINPALFDAEFYTQGAFIDLGGLLPGPDIRLTNGYLIQVGAP